MLDVLGVLGNIVVVNTGDPVCVSGAVELSAPELVVSRNS